MLLLEALQPSLAPARDRGMQEEVRVDTRREGGVTDMVVPRTWPPPDPGHSRPRRDDTAVWESLMVHVMLGEGLPAGDG